MAAPSTSRPPLREITTPNARPLAPIFTLHKRRAIPSSSSSSSPPECFQLRTPTSSSPLKHVGTRKRVRGFDESEDEDAVSKIVVAGLSLGKQTARSRREVDKCAASAKRLVDDNPFLDTGNDAPGVARRSRRRTIAFEAINTHDYSRGLQTGDRSMSYRTMHAPDVYLSTLTHSLTSPHSFLRFPSFRPPDLCPREFAPPVSSAMSWSAKYLPQRTDATGPKRLLAVGNEEGFVTIVDVDRELFHEEDADYASGGGMGYGLTGTSQLMDLHQSTIFDIKWSGDDRRLLSMSADMTSSLHDVSSSAPRLLANLKGHTASAKAGVFFDPSRSAAYDAASMPSTVIATSGRDGNILIYDLRCKGWALPDGVTRRGAVEAKDDHSVFPVASIKNAHGQAGKRPTAARTAIRSVTSLLALEGMPGTLASGGSCDGIVKLWDVRFPSATSSRSFATSSKPRPPSTTAACSLPDPNTRFRRQRAILSLNEDPTTGDIYALSGSRIHALSPSTGTCHSQTYTHPKLLGDSFFIKSSLSPDGRYLAAGSKAGGLVTWEVAKGKAGGEVTGTFFEAGNPACDVTSVAWGQDILATSSDDLVTKLWRPNPEASRNLRQDPQAASHKWIGARA